MLWQSGQSPDLIATLVAAKAGGVATHGHMRPGARADIVHLNAALVERDAWIVGVRV